MKRRRGAKRGDGGLGRHLLYATQTPTGRGFGEYKEVLEERARKEHHSTSPRNKWEFTKTLRAPNSRTPLQLRPQ